MKIPDVHASVHLPYDHHMLVQNLSAQVIDVHEKSHLMDILSLLIVVNETAKAANDSHKMFNLPLAVDTTKCYIC